jgi:DNA-binding response OmpR family regulator
VLADERTAPALPPADARARATVLVVEDDPASQALLRRLLEQNDLEVLSAPTGADGLRTLFQRHPDLVLLDVGLPDADGTELLARIRDLSDVPVVMVSARDEEAVKVRALRSGADDYLTKPFGLQELVARIDVLLRRSMRSRPSSGHYGDGLVKVDYVSLEVEIAGRPVDLTALELKLLMAFVEHPNQVLSADQLLQRVWGDSALPRERVKLYVAYLRDKFRAAGAEAPIETVRGFGYRYRPPYA